MESEVLDPQLWVLVLETGPTRPSSPRSLLMATPAASAAASGRNPVAGAQGCVAAEAGHRQGECGQRSPARSGAWVARLAGARVREVALSVRQTVVEQALCTPQATETAHQQATRVWGLRAATTTPICSTAEECSAVHTARRLLRLRGGLGRSWGHSLCERGG